MTGDEGALLEGATCFWVAERVGIGLYAVNSSVDTSDILKAKKFPTKEACTEWTRTNIGAAARKHFTSVEHRIEGAGE